MNTTQKITLLSSMLIISHLSFGQEQENQNSADKIIPEIVTNHTFKTYEDGSQISYFRIKGNYSIKELHRMEQRLIDTEGVVSVSIFDKNPQSDTHMMCIKTESDIATKQWLNEKIQSR